MNEVVGIREAAHMTDVTRQAVYIAIRTARLKATKEKNWLIKVSDLNEYRDRRWDRTNTKINGKPMVSNDKGEYLVRQIAVILGVPTQKVYYDIRMRRLKAQRNGTAYIIKLADAMEYKKKYLEVAA